MTKNMGTADRIIRTLVALAIAVLFFTGKISGTLAIVLGVSQGFAWDAAAAREAAIDQQRVVEELIRHGGPAGLRCRGIEREDHPRKRGCGVRRSSDRSRRCCWSWRCCCRSVPG